jgi:hypothetical protein
MRDRKNDKAWVVAWRGRDSSGYGDAYFTYEEAEEYSIRLNETYLHMFHYPMHREEVEDASEDN